MDKVILNNGIETIIKTNKNTPRTAIAFYIRFNKMNISKSGMYYLLASLMFQGTKNRTGEELAIELNENAIEIYFTVKSDYLVFKILCLNEDVERALEIFQDMLENTTFDSVEKEAQKIKGELEAEMDSSRKQAQDEFYRTIYKNHYYSYGMKEAIEQIGSITKQELFEIFYQLKFVTAKNIFVVSDKSKEDILPLIEKHLASLSVKDTEYRENKNEAITQDRISTVVKEDANQAQIYMGWHAPYMENFREFISFMLMNNVLGSSGLSSRLFLELREKKGLAYTVRSVYETFRLGSCFYVYIATEPKNIKTAIDGFKTEIDKIMTELISDEELESAKNRAIGRKQFAYETNMSEAITRGLYQYLGFDLNYDEKIENMIKDITKEDIMNTAKKYLSGHNALCVLAPSEYLKEANLI
ncbi:insulinase family protein [bacterium]|nr:insulinase family protein [bacterium]